MRGAIDLHKRCVGAQSGGAYLGGVGGAGDGRRQHSSPQEMISKLNLRAKWALIDAEGAAHEKTGRRQIATQAQRT